MKYKVELAEFHVIEIDAESKTVVMDDEDILAKSISDSGMTIWDVWEA